MKKRKKQKILSRIPENEKNLQNLLKELKNPPFRSVSNKLNLQNFSIHLQNLNNAPRPHPQKCRKKPLCFWPTPSSQIKYVINECSLRIIYNFYFFHFQNTILLLIGLPWHAVIMLINMYPTNFIISSGKIPPLGYCNASHYTPIQLHGYSNDQKKRIALKVQPTLNKDMLQKLVENDFAYHGFHHLHERIIYFMKEIQGRDEMTDPSWYRSDVQKPRSLSNGKKKTHSCESNQIFKTSNA